MSHEAWEFRQHVHAILDRFAAQNGTTFAAGDVAATADRLWALVEERGLPRPLAPHERGAPGELAEAELAPLVARVTAGFASPLLADAAKHLLKACVYPEFKTCRDSFRAVAPDGSCRRQELGRARRRVSGAHCVDCPYWVSLDAPAHRAFLRREWHGAPAGFEAHAGEFLPEDFRAWRRWLHAAARDAGVRD